MGPSSDHVTTNKVMWPTFENQKFEERQENTQPTPMCKSLYRWEYTTTTALLMGPSSDHETTNKVMWPTFENQKFEERQENTQPTPMCKSLYRWEYTTTTALLIGPSPDHVTTNKVMWPTFENRKFVMWQSHVTNILELAVQWKYLCLLHWKCSGYQHYEQDF